jgi:hypothetical protein
MKVQSIIRYLALKGQLISAQGKALGIKKQQQFTP